MLCAIESVFTLWRFLRLKTSLSLIRSAFSQWTRPYLHYFFYHLQESVRRSRPLWAVWITRPYLHYFAQELFAQLFDVHDSFLFVLYSNGLHNQDAYYDILSGILFGDSSFAISFDFLIGLPCISYLYDNAFSPILSCEHFGILFGSSIPGPLHRD